MTMSNGRTRGVAGGTCQTGVMYAERPSRLPGGVLWRAAGRPPSAPVLPDGCSDLMFDGATLLIAGPDTTAYVAEPGRFSEPGHFTGLRMASGIGPSMWGVPGSELVNQRVPVADLWPRAEVDRLTDLITAAADPDRVLESIVARRWRGSPPDHVMVSIARELRRGVSVASVAARSGLSERQLHRRSLAAYGYGAKMLARILRMNAALDGARSGAGFAAVAADCGYADQAHLSRDVRALTGQTLSSLLAT